MHSYVHCIIIYNSQDMEAPQMPINRQVDKKPVVHIYNGILIGLRKEWNFTTCNSMDGPGAHYAKWNKQSGKDKYHDFTHMWNEQNELTNKIETGS